MLYAVEPPFTGLRDVLRARPKTGGLHEWQEDLRRMVDTVAGLTAVDGATIVNDRYEVLALGAKITRRRGAAPVEQVSYTEPVEGQRALADRAHATGGHAAPLRRTVRTRSAGRDGAGGFAGRAVHDLQVVAVRGDRARASGGCVVAVEGVNGRPRLRALSAGA